MLAYLEPLASDTRESRPFLFGGKRSQKVGVLILKGIRRAGVQRNWIKHCGALGDLKAGLDIGRSSHFEVVTVAPMFALSKIEFN
jgi:hypothetical protein